MIFNTMGNKANPAILFFHAMGVTGDSSIPVADSLKEQYYCIMPTSTVYCAGQKYADLKLAKKVCPRKFPQAKLMVWPGRGHCTYITEAPVQYAAMLKAYMNGEEI